MLSFSVTLEMGFGLNYDPTREKPPMCFCGALVAVEITMCMGFF